MDFDSFKASTSDPEPPEGLIPALEALWWDAKGDWDKAHECAQTRDDRPGMHVHAYLHRKEGDPSNAAYWYRRAGAEPSALPFDEDWAELVRTLLAWR